jgi:hypothetical protein
MLTKMISSALTLKDQCSHCYYTAVAEVLTGLNQSEKIEIRDTTANFGKQTRKQDHLLKRIQSMP